MDWRSDQDAMMVHEAISPPALNARWGCALLAGIASTLFPEFLPIPAGSASGTPHCSAARIDFTGPGLTDWVLIVILLPIVID